MNSRYVLRPKADQDLDEQAYYFATKAGVDTGHRFLLAAHETFALISTQPQMGWRVRVRHPRIGSLRAFRISNFERLLVLYLPLSSAIEIVRIVHGSRDIEAFLRHEKI